MPLVAVETEMAFPVRVASIDVGSNALRFLAAEFTAPEKLRTIVRLSIAKS